MKLPASYLMESLGQIQETLETDVPKTSFTFKFKNKEVKHAPQTRIFFGNFATCYLWLFYLAEFIIWNIKSLQHQVANETA